MDLTFWCSIAGIAVSVIAVIIIFMTRYNILNILDKDIILFDKNFELKKNAINEAMDLADQIAQSGKGATLRADFEEKAKSVYNSLLCIMTNAKIADEFYSIAIDKNASVDNIRIAKFKLACRKDLGLKNKHSKAIKQQKSADLGSDETMLRTNVATGSNSGFSAGTSSFASQPKVAEEPRLRPTTPTPRPAAPTQPAQPTQLRPNPAPRPLQPRPMNRPTDSAPKE
ncbi:MAG: hypothetical protein IKC49_02405 [Clostridia bacterium]|nr:hypothetical protein [Clostridia bacterium]